MQQPTKREQILDAARRCFYERGITATGVDAIAAAAGVSKRTLYNHFASKDDLVHAYVERRDRWWRSSLAGRLEGVTDPVDRILAYFDAYFDLPEGEDFRGCALINAAAELPEPESRTLSAVRANKERVRKEVGALVHDAGIDDAETVADGLVLLLEGSVALSGVFRERRGVETAKQAARKLLGVGEGRGA
ncbi:MAG TPA: TetR/AcrR family transcriptional regulator [Acidimicrobiales bacterium]